MPGFNAQEIVEEFDYNFEADGGGKGRVPTPTMAEARKFRDALTTVQRVACGLPEEKPDDETDTALQDALNEMTPQQRDALNDGAVDLVADLCKGTPSRDELLARSGPVLYAFTNWLQVELSPLY